MTTARSAPGAPDATLDPVRSAVYLPEVVGCVPHLLSQLDREPDSRTFGSFDREQWSWKFRDFPLGMLQVATYPLAMLWRLDAPGNAYFGNPRLLEWIDGAIACTLRRQRRNGAFDAFAPNEQDPGPTLGIAHGLCETLRWLGEAVAPARRDEAEAAIRRAADFALPRDEEHGFISNHQALFASTFLSAHEITGVEAYRERADRIVERILELQSDDGWYHEYGGPDPGYESLGIFHLAMIWRRTRSERLLDSLRRAVHFHAHCIHLDGSIGGAYGSRHTSLYFPGGFEILAPVLPEAAGVAAFMRAAMHRQNVVTAAQVDIENLTPLAYTYLEACMVTEPATTPVAPPCEVFRGLRLFTDASLTVAGTQHYYAVLHGGRGGMIRVHDRATGEILYEDAGYLVETSGGRWASQASGMDGAGGRLDGSEVACWTSLGEVRQELLTPLRFLVLRLLNLTVFASPRVGKWIRRAVVARLITSRRSGPFELLRTVHFGEDELRFRDRLEPRGRGDVKRVVLTRTFTGIHMGSAKYFHPAELRSIPAVDVSGLAARLAAGELAVNEFRIGVGGHETASAHSAAAMIPSVTGRRS